MSNANLKSTFELFGVGSDTPAWEVGTDNPFVPALDPDYRFNEESLMPVLYWLAGLKMGSKDALMLTGPTGAGKSSLICQVCARLKQPLQRINGHRFLETMDLHGRMGIVGGDTIFMDGPLTTAYREGHLFLLDEIDLIDPGTNAGLNTVLEYAPINIAENGGEIIEPAAGFGFVATGNSAGNGDDGAYAGVTTQNQAFMDRFMVSKVGYPEIQVESEILAKAAPNIPEEYRDGMISVANHVRNLYQEGECGIDGVGAANIECTFSTRTLLRWARLMVLSSGASKQPSEGVPRHTLKMALTNRAAPASAEAIDMIAETVFGGEE